jgi:WD40 repeat protein
MEPTPLDKERELVCGRRVWSLAFSPDSNRLVSGDCADMVTFWDATNGFARGDQQLLTSWVISMAFSPDSRWLAIAEYGRKVTVWDMADGFVKRHEFVRRPIVSMYSVAFSPDSR